MAAAAALPCAVGSPAEVQHAFTALLSCLVNPLREHENTGKKEREGGEKKLQSRYYFRWFDVICVDYKTPGFIIACTQGAERREVGLEIQNFN